MLLSKTVRNVLIFVGCACVTLTSAQSESDSSSVDKKPSGLQHRVETTVVHSARLGEIDANTSVFRSYSNAEISAYLNEFHKLSPFQRREILLEVSRRIREEGEFVVEKHEQRFGRVVSVEVATAEPDPDEPQLEEEVVVGSMQAEDESAERVRPPEVRQSRPPVRRVNSGRAYSQ